MTNRQIMTIQHILSGMAVLLAFIIPALVALKG